MNLDAYSRALSMSTEVICKFLQPKQITNQPESEQLTSPNRIAAQAQHIISSHTSTSSSSIPVRKEANSQSNQIEFSELYPSSDAARKLIKHRTRYPIFGYGANWSYLNQKTDSLIREIYEDKNDIFPLLLALAEDDASALISVLNAYEKIEGGLPVIQPQVNCKMENITNIADAMTGIRRGTSYLLNGHFDIAKQYYNWVIRTSRNINTRQEAEELLNITNRLSLASKYSPQESVTSERDLSPTNPLSPLAQLKRWTAKSTPFSEPLKIAGGIPQITISVQFSSKQFLKIPPHIETREEFILFLAQNADVHLWDIYQMFKLGKIYGNIIPIHTTPETEAFFRKFIHNCTSPYTPAFVRPVSEASIASFKTQNPQLMLKLGEIYANFKPIHTTPETEAFFKEFIHNCTSPYTPAFVRPVSEASIASFATQNPQLICTTSSSSSSSTISTIGDLSEIIPAPHTPLRLENESKQPLCELPSPEPTTRRLNQSSIIPSSLLAQLRSWTTQSTLSSEPFRIKGGIPQITFSIQCFLGADGKGGKKVILTTPAGMETRKEFLLFLARKADMDPEDINFMLETGRIYESIQAIDTDSKTETFFKEFVHSSYEFQSCPQPCYVQPIPIEEIDAFKARFPATFNARYFKENPRLPQIDISVKFPNFPETKLTIPPNIETMDDFLLFLIGNALMSASDKEQICNTGKMIGSVRLIDADRASELFFEKFLQTPVTQLPLSSPSITIYVKFPLSKPFILNIPNTVKSHKEFIRLLGSVAVNVEIPSHIKAYAFTTGEIQPEVILIDNDPKRMKFFQRLCNSENLPSFISVPFQPMETMSVPSLSSCSRSFVEPISSIPKSLASSTIAAAPSITPLMFRSSAPIPPKVPPPENEELPQVNFQVIIKNEINTPCFLKAPPNINSLDKFKLFIKESLARQGKGVLPSFSIWGGGNALRNYDKLREIFSDSPVVLHVFGTTQLTTSSIPQPSAFDLTSTTELRELPQRLIEIAVSWTFSASDRDFSKYYHTVQITPRIRSLEEFKQFLKARISTLHNFADFDVMYRMDDNWIRADSEDKLMLYFEQLQEYRTPFFACVERKLPEPDLSKPQPPAPRQPEPEPILNINSVDELKMYLEAKIPELATKLANFQIECTVGSAKFTIDNIETLTPYFQRIRNYRIPFYVSVKDKPKAGPRIFRTKTEIMAIPDEISSLVGFKRFLQRKEPLLVANFADFEIRCIVNDTTLRVDNIEELTSYHTVIKKYRTPFFARIEGGELTELMKSKHLPFFACVERRLPEPDLSKLQLPALRQPEPEPFSNTITFYDPTSTHTKFLNHKIKKGNATIENCFINQRFDSGWKHRIAIKDLEREFKRVESELKKTAKSDRKQGIANKRVAVLHTVQQLIDKEEVKRN